MPCQNKNKLFGWNRKNRYLQDSADAGFCNLRSTNKFCLLNLCCFLDSILEE